MGEHEMPSTASNNEPSSNLSPEDAERMAKYGIVRIPVDYFHYGKFRYTNLKDAIAQAERQEIRD
jgi:hypothetical protein